jgi:hypothetical protein
MTAFLPDLKEDRRNGACSVAVISSPVVQFPISVLHTIKWIIVLLKRVSNNAGCASGAAHERFGYCPYELDAVGALIQKCTPLTDVTGPGAQGGALPENLAEELEAVHPQVRKLAHNHGGQYILDDASQVSWQRDRCATTLCNPLASRVPD